MSKERIANLKDFFKSKYLDPIPAEAEALPASSVFSSMNSESGTEETLTPTTISSETFYKEQFQINLRAEVHAPLSGSDAAKCKDERGGSLYFDFGF